MEPPFPYPTSSHSIATMRRLLPVALLLIAAPAQAQIHGRIYPIPKVDLATAHLPPGASLITVTTRDNLVLKGVAIPAKPGRPTLLVFHGNGSTADDTVEWFAPILAQGYGIVAAEYREYGGNPGRADETGLAADADAFYAEARTRAGTAPVYVVGHSLGSGVAFGLAMRQKLDLLVTIGAFTRLRAMAPRLVRALVKDRYDNLADVASLDEPYVLIHGLADDVVSPYEGKALGETASRQGKDVIGYFITAADHRPDGATLATILADAERRLGGDDATPTLSGMQMFAGGRFAAKR